MWVLNSTVSILTAPNCQRLIIANTIITQHHKTLVIRSHFLSPMQQKTPRNIYNRFSFFKRFFDLILICLFCFSRNLPPSPPSIFFLNPSNYSFTLPIFHLSPHSHKSSSPQSPTKTPTNPKNKVK